MVVVAIPFLYVPSGQGVTVMSKINKSQEVAGKQQKTMMVDLSKIDLEDERYQFRDKTRKPCSPKDFTPEKGVVDLTHVHPVILQPTDAGTYRIVNGFGRITAMKKNLGIKRLKCKVITNASEDEMVVLAARVNLGHGNVLGRQEKKRCFLKEIAALKAAGKQCPTNRTMAKAYQVSPTTIGNWLRQRNKSGGVSSHDASEGKPGASKGATSSAMSPVASDEVSEGTSSGITVQSISVQFGQEPPTAEEVDLSLDNVDVPDLLDLDEETPDEASMTKITPESSKLVQRLDQLTSDVERYTKSGECSQKLVDQLLKKARELTGHLSAVCSNAA